VADGFATSAFCRWTAAGRPWAKPSNGLYDGGHDDCRPTSLPCPPGACICGRDPLLEMPGADLRILLLTRQEEKRLLERLENLQSLADLERLQQRMFEQITDCP